MFTDCPGEALMPDGSTFREMFGPRGVLRTMVKLDPQQADAWIMLVWIAAARGGGDEARKVPGWALARLPHHPALLELSRQL